MQDTQELTREQRDEQYYKPHLEAYYRFQSLKTNEDIAKLSRGQSELEEMTSSIDHPLATILLHLIIYPFGILNSHFQRFLAWIARTEKRHKINNEETLDYDYRVDKRLRQFDNFTKHKFNFELFRSSTKPDYLTRLRQKTDEMNNTQLSYEDELGI